MHMMDFVQGPSTTSEADYMYQVRGEEESKFLEEGLVDMLHHEMSQLLFIITRDIKDIHMTVLSVLTQVKLPYEYFWGN